MRRVLVLSFALFAGCSERAEPQPAAAPREHPLAQDGSTARAITSTPDRVKVQLDLAVVRAGVQAFRVEKGAWPSSIGELSVEGLNYPADLTYDPGTGKVGSQTYPDY